VGRIKAIAHRAAEKLRGVPDRAENPYATHLPVLLALARLLDVKRVLEFGCGDFSTGTFLDRRAFPKLERLESYENDAEWAKRVRDAAQDDPRLDLRVTRGAIADAAKAAAIEDFDLILVDDSIEAPLRIATLTTVAQRRPMRAAVVVHDFELPFYREPTGAFRHRFRFTPLNPNTGVAWNHDRLREADLKRLVSVVRKHRDRIKVDDRAAWVELIEREVVGR
jgi:hypothetical protein